jgi:hypothetical protein
VYNFSYTDAVRGPAHRVVPPVQAPPPQAPTPQVATPAPAQVPQVPTPPPVQPPTVPAPQVPTPAPAQTPTVQAPQVPTPTPAQAPKVPTPAPAQAPASLVISEPRKPVQSESTSIVQSEPEISDLPPLENDSGPTSPQPVQFQPQVPDRLRDLLAQTQLHNRVVTGSFSSDEFEAAAKFQAALRAKEQLAALLAKNLQLEQRNKRKPIGTN